MERKTGQRRSMGTRCSFIHPEVSLRSVLKSRKDLGGLKSPQPHLRDAKLVEDSATRKIRGFRDASKKVDQDADRADLGGGEVFPVVS